MGHRLKLTLPYPPSANNYWRLGFIGRNKKRPTIFKTKEARDYQQNARRTAAMQGAEPVVGNVDLSLKLFRPAKRGDLDNTLKVLLDALKGVAYIDDNQVIGITATRHDDASNPRVEIEMRAESQLFSRVS